MNNDFVAEILRATGTLQSGDPAGVTAIIQNALAAAGLAASTGASPQGRPNTSFQLPQMLLPPAEHIEGMVATGQPEPRDDIGADIYQPKELRSQRLRKPLGEVLRTLAAARNAFGPDGNLPGLGMPLRVPDLPMPKGAEFRDLHYSCEAGARRYRLYVPASAGDGLQGLVVMLHGCTQNPEDFAAGTGMNGMAEEHRLLIAYPAQSGGHNSMSCWNWFRPEDQMRDAGEPAIIAGITREIAAEFCIPQDRIFIAGLSAGGAMAAVMGETYPELYAGVGIHSGLAYGSANDVMSAFAAMRGQSGLAPVRSRGNGTRPRMIVFHGSVDYTVSPSNAERILAAAQAALPEATVRTKQNLEADGRAYGRTVLETPDGATALEFWLIDGAGHAWSGGHPEGSYTDPRGPDASAEMVRFFMKDI